MIRATNFFPTVPDRNLLSDPQRWHLQGTRLPLGGVDRHGLSPLARQAYDAIEKNGQQARGLASLLLLTEYRRDLPDNEREAIVDRWIADSAERQHRFLVSLGLVRDTANPFQYGPGTWRLTAEREGAGHVFVISGIRAPGGAEVSARLTARDFCRAALAWRAIARSLGAGKVLKPRAGEWRRVWHGFEYSVGRRQRRIAHGIGGVMHREMVKRENDGANHASD